MANRIVRTITNELGNEIRLEVTKEPSGILIYAEGPTSTVEHMWTSLEAMNIRDMLVAIFGEQFAIQENLTDQE